MRHIGVPIGLCLTLAASAAGAVAGSDYATWLGGASAEQAYAIELAPDGDVIIAGRTSSPGFPFTPGCPITPVFPLGVQQSQPFVARIDPAVAGPAGLVYACFLGGTTGDGGGQANGVAVDDEGNAYVVGFHTGVTLPIVGGFSGPPGDHNNAFLVKLSADGTQLLYSTYVGASNNLDDLEDVVVDDDGIATAVGRSASSNFPFKNGFTPNKANGLFDAIVVQIDTELTGAASLLYSTSYGGISSEWGWGIARGPTGLIYVTGTSDSYQAGGLMPTTANAIQSAPAGGADCFIAVFDTTVSGVGSLVYGTYLGGNYTEQPGVLTVGDDGDAFFVSGTQATTFPVTPGAYDSTADVTFGPGARSDLVLARVAPFAASGSESLVWSTYVGGQQNEYARDIVLDVLGRPVITGRTESPTFPVSSCSPPKNDGVSVYVLRFTADGAFDFGRFYGGLSSDVGEGIAMTAAGTFAVTGWSASNNLPITATAVQTVKPSPTFDDAFVALLEGCPEPPVSLDDLYTTPEDQPLVVAALGGVLANDLDPEGGQLTASLVDGPEHGDVVLHPDGGFTYDPDPGFDEVDSFTYAAHDPDGLTDLAVVYLDIIPGTPPVCQPCPQGMATAPPPECCVACPPGSALSAADDVCRPCPQATASPDGLSCEPCAEGLVAEGAGNVMCLPCVCGQEPSAGQDECLPCPAGQVSHGFDACVACPPGSVVGAGSCACLECPPGAAPNAELTACETCPPGTESPDGVACEPCPPGWIAPDPGEDSCNSYCYCGGWPDASADECVWCEPGTYAFNGPCVACPAGQVSGFAACGCESCPPGSQPNADHSACELCPPGTESPDGVACVPCLPGWIAPEPGEDSCNSYCYCGGWPDESADECVWCEPGTYAFNGPCVSCPAGQVSGFAACGCESCSAGTQANAAHTGCDACPPGTASSDGVACEPCPDGFVSEDAGQEQCEACPAGSEPNADQTGCVPMCTANQLAALDIAGLVPAFHPAIQVYTMPPPPVSIAAVTATLCDPTKKLYIQSVQVVSGTLIGAWVGNNVMQLSIYQNWTKIGGYTIHVDPSLPPAPLTNGLANLVVPGMVPSFDPAITNYTVPANASDIIPVTATLSNPSHKLYIEGNPSQSGQLTNTWAPLGNVIDISVLIGWTPVGLYHITVVP